MWISKVSCYHFKRVSSAGRALAVSRAQGRSPQLLLGFPLPDVTAFKNSVPEAAAARTEVLALALTGRRVTRALRRVAELSLPGEGAVLDLCLHMSYSLTFACVCFLMQRKSFDRY